MFRGSGGRGGGGLGYLRFRIQRARVRAPLGSPCSVLSKTYLPTPKVLVITRKRWLRPKMTEKLFTVTFSIKMLSYIWKYPYTLALAVSYRCKNPHCVPVNCLLGLICTEKKFGRIMPRMTCTHNLCLSKNKNNITIIFHPIFAVQACHQILINKVFISLWIPYVNIDLFVKLFFQ